MLHYEATLRKRTLDSVLGRVMWQV
jgi:hypothetical protein